MDTLVAVQKLFRRRALIQDSPLSSGDVPVKPAKETRPGEPKSIFHSWVAHRLESGAARPRVGTARHPLSP